MRATWPLAIAAHDECGRHEPFPGHPERPGRLAAALAGADGLGGERLAVAVEEGSVLRALAPVHGERFPARLKAACEAAPGVFDTPDNPVSAGTYRAALAAAACALAAVDAAASGRASRVWVPIRPPGHHALRDRAMGFCFFNNAAIAAEAMLARGIGPVAVVDFDVHHGNGTQLHFWERSDAYFLSVHRYPFFPGSGSGDEIGSGAGRGFTRNFPLAAGSGDDVYCAAVEAGLEEIVTAITPAAWVVSAGFDAHRDDPLGGMSVTEDGFAVIGRMLCEVAAKTPVVAVLEGGYEPKALSRSVRSFLSTLAGADYS